MKLSTFAILASVWSGSVFATPTPPPEPKAEPPASDNHFHKEVASQYSKEQQQAIVIVDEMTQAYNDQDIASFITYFDEQVRFYVYPDKLMFTGKEQLIARYGVMFKKLHCLKSTPIKRIVHGNFIIDHELSESCSVKPDFIDKRSKVVVSYEVTDGRINSVLFFKSTTH
ncbi:nuclear transport factor 2 family protein [Pseudoalteromonas sp. SSDWG2]|uniref:nuclear transport factor 2 family protein n=1 Tax=Pseudoalteromonas sp. SSDWG2 TaxID=3139391 RepID=UPI003BA93274